MEDSVAIVISQNLKLESLTPLKNKYSDKTVVIISTHGLFEFEKLFLKGIFRKVIFLNFAFLLSDEIMAKCDQDAYSPEISVSEYYDRIKLLKNMRVIEALNGKYSFSEKIIASDDLGILEEVWIQSGYRHYVGEYYYVEKKNVKNSSKSFITAIKKWMRNPIYSVKIEDKKYIFYGKMLRIAYRFTLDFSIDKKENYFFVISKILEKLIGKYPVRKNVLH